MCLSPVSITRELAGRKYTQVVPCNHCVECKSKEQQAFVNRCSQAAKDLGNVWFITLTYNEDNVPVQYDLDGEIQEVNPETGEVMFAPSARHRTLDRQDIKNWKKRVKMRYERKYGKKLSLNYMICGEYGPQTHRPHYHAMFFGLDQDAKNMLEQDWKENYGFTFFKYVPSFSIDGVNQVDRVSKYCSKYCIKVEELEDEQVKQHLVQKPRKMTSKGLGFPQGKDFIALQRYYLAQDVYEYNPDTACSELNPDQIKTIIQEIKKRRKDGKLSNYLIKKLYYTKDSFGNLRAPQIQKMVSHSLQMDIQKEYSRKLAEIATRECLSEDFEGYRKASKIMEEDDRLCKEERRNRILSYNLDYLRKSRQ